MQTFSLSVTKTSYEIVPKRFPGDESGDRHATVELAIDAAGAERHHRSMASAMDAIYVAKLDRVARVQTHRKSIYHPGLDALVQKEGL